MSLKKVYLHGSLAEFSAEPIELAVTSFADAYRALKARFGVKFQQAIKAGEFHLVKGQFKTTKKGEISLKNKAITQEQVNWKVKEDELHFVPKMAGSGKYGRLVVGALLVVVGVVVDIYSYGTAHSLAEAFYVAGFSMMVGGVVDLLTPVPKIKNYTDQQGQTATSFLFNGAFNVTTQGGPVPLVYGHIRAGSTVISAGSTIEQVVVDQPQGPGQDYWDHYNSNGGYY